MEHLRYMLSTETTCDMDPDYYTQNGINTMGLTLLLDGKEYDCVGENTISIKEFYRILRSGALPKTSQVTVDKAYRSFETLFKAGYDVLHISFSSALSGTYQSCTIAAQELASRYPERKIRVIDSKCASMGQGLLLNRAVTLKAQGKSLQEVADQIEKEKLTFCHNFTVDDLFHLHRGGRVSKMTAILGSALGIKPLLHVDDEGRLINVGKTRGRKASLNWLVDKMAEQFVKEKNDVVYISHGDCYDDAKYVADLVKRRFGIHNIVIGDVGPVIGAHSGPGTVALFFVGKSRAI